MQKSTVLAIFAFVQVCLFIGVTSSEVKMPVKCASKTFCYSKKQPPDYPEHVFRKLLNAIKLQSVVEPDTRLGPDAQNLVSEVCRVKETARLVYQIVDFNDRVRWVAQVNDSFIQQYRIAECRQPGRVCEERSPMFTKDKLDEFDVRCVNKMVDIKFVVLSEDEQSLELVGVKGGIPMGCYCTYDVLPSEDVGTCS